MLIVANPRTFKIPDWFLNRQKDHKDGRNSQLTSSQLDTKLREDLERLKKIRSALSLIHTMPRVSVPGCGNTVSPLLCGKMGAGRQELLISGCLEASGLMVWPSWSRLIGREMLLGPRAVTKSCLCFLCRNHRGLRHYWGLRVKGQHTKTTGRRGKTVGVAKKR